MSTITRTLVAIITATLLATGLAGADAATAAPNHRQDMHKVFVRCNGPQVADSVWVDTPNRIAFASTNFPGDQEINRIVRVGACVALSVGDRGMLKALNRMFNRISEKHPRSTITNNGVRVTIMVTRSYRVGWDIAYVRR